MTPPRLTSISRNITLVGNGGIDVALHPFTWSGNISGSGQLIKRGRRRTRAHGHQHLRAGALLEAGGT